ncbi:MAG: acyl-CoA dehydrogenase [Rhodospirillales bacterium]|nr:acyl-CoA dehydrogenase [Rhodospirillales bacterium]
MSMVINRRDLDFLLYEVFATQSLLGRDKYADHDLATFNAVLDTAHGIAEEKFATHAAKSDEQEPTFDGTRVHIIPEVADALSAYVDAGFLAAPFDYDAGGMQLPWTIIQACNALFMSANAGTAAYPFLAIAAGNVINSFGTEEQKKQYFEPIVEGRFFGTMCLSEPQAGSSLSDIRTKAEPTDEDHYLISGNKMWISGGEHDLSENIVHMVLAKIPGGPPGVKGISLFIVPKFLINADGSLGPRNDVALAGLNHKMGYRGTVNTLLNFGENGKCVGYLVGEPHKGLRYMFHMMNEARIGIGLGAAMIAYAGYLYSLDYARNRPQGRLPGSKDATAPQVMIIEHADVRRMLLSQKASVEGSLALCLYSARLIDDQRTVTDEKERAEIDLLLEILTPVVKSWPSEHCLEANSLAIQILGGYGYTREYPVERLYRDNRLNPIHEGTTAIHGIDILGRKVTMNNGAAFDLLMTKINETAQEAGALDELAEMAAPLAQAVVRLRVTTARLTEVGQEGNTDLCLANATVYLDMVGTVVMAWMWITQALVAVRALPLAKGDDVHFYQGKIQACRYFLRWELPKTEAEADLLESLDSTCLDMPVDAF